MRNISFSKLWFIPPLLIGFALMVFIYLMQPAAHMTLDVNPSIEVVTNRLDQVVSVNPLNEDADRMLQKFKPENKSLQETMDELVELLVVHGYFKSGQENMVMISFQDNDANPEIANEINRALTLSLEKRQIDATLLASNLDYKEDSSKGGKSAIIQKMAEMGVTLSEESMSSMTLKELFEYSRTQDGDVEKLFHVIKGEDYQDELPQTGMMTPEQIQKRILAQFPGELIKLEYDEDDYEASILLDSSKIELEIDAYTGTVEEVEFEDLKDNDSDNPVSPAPSATPGTIHDEKDDQDDGDDDEDSGNDDDDED